MISHSHRLIYIHIPKTGGTSIEHALGHFQGHVGRGGQDHRTLRELQWPHGKLNELANARNIREGAKSFARTMRRVDNPNNRSKVNKREYQEYFKFAIVRDPWSRAYSWYQNVMRDPVHQRALKVNTSMDFDEFIDRFAGRGMLRPQMDWIVDLGGRVGVDMVGKFDDLSSAFADACQRAGVGEVALPHDRKGDTATYRENLSGKARDLIAVRYADEIDRFGFSFE